MIEVDHFAAPNLFVTAYPFDLGEPRDGQYIHFVHLFTALSCRRY